MRYLTLAVLGAAGCVSLNPMAMVRLATMNPIEADPAVIAVQLTLPEGVGVAEGTAAMTISANFAGTEEWLEQRFELENTGDVWRIAQTDQDALRALQRRVIVAEAADPDAVNGSFSVGFQPCAMGNGPEEDARVSMAVQLDEGGGFLPLVNRARVAEMYDAADIDALGSCDRQEPSRSGPRA